MKTAKSAAWKAVRKESVEALELAISRAKTPTDFLRTIGTSFQQLYSWRVAADHEQARPISDNFAIKIEQHYDVPAEKLQPHRVEYWRFVKRGRKPRKKSDKPAAGE